MKRKADLSLQPRISAIDLFCGIGGLTHGLLRGGVNVKAGIDVDEACRYPYESNNDAVFMAADVKNLSAAAVRSLFGESDIQLLAGCAPCQPFSTYSRTGRTGRGDADWDLVQSFGCLIKKIQPQLVTMENVPAVQRHSVFQTFLEDLTGYHVAWSTVECSAIGVPQTRKRFVLLASRLGPEGLALRADDIPKATVRDTIAALPKLRAGEASPHDPLHIACRLSELNLRRIRASRPGGTWRDWDPSLRAVCHRKSTGDTFPSVYGRMDWDEPAPTMTTQCFGYGNGRFGHPEQDRAITLREAAMLQTFPVNYRFVREGEKVRFDLIGRQIGNAVPVRLGQLIAETFRKHVERYAAISVATLV
jgi:DNA (cytosine-5)-methyltransferase 1